MRTLTFHFTNWDTLYSKLVNWWTGEAWSHVHVSVNGLDHYEIAAGGVAHWFPTANFSTPKAYHKVEVPVTDVEWGKAVSFLNQQRNKKYDWLGVIGTALRVRGSMVLMAMGLPCDGAALRVRGLKRSPDKWYCSSLCAALYNECIAGQRGWIADIPVKITPTELLEHITLNQLESFGR